MDCLIFHPYGMLIKYKIASHVLTEVLVFLHCFCFCCYLHQRGSLHSLLFASHGNPAVQEKLKILHSLSDFWDPKRQKEFFTSEWGVPEMGLFFGVSEGLTPLLFEPQQPIIQS